VRAIVLDLDPGHRNGDQALAVPLASRSDRTITASASE
jgi:hypothetical protein